MKLTVCKNQEASANTHSWPYPLIFLCRSQEINTMNAKTLISLGITSIILMLSASQANAAEAIRVKCGKRADRSVISVDGKKLDAGLYSALVISGSNQKASNPPAVAPVGREVEFDFSSKPADQAAGATPIGIDFVQGQVTGQILDDTGYVVAQATANCRVR
jgi:hypothetical protein